MDYARFPCVAGCILGNSLARPIVRNWQDLVDRAQLVVGVRGARRVSAIADGTNGGFQQLAGGDDRAIGRAEMLQGAVHDGAHRLLHSPVLGIDAVDTGERFRLLDLAIDQPIVLPVTDGAEAAGDIDIWPERIPGVGL